MNVFKTNYSSDVRFEIAAWCLLLLVVTPARRRVNNSLNKRTRRFRLPIANRVRPTHTGVPTPIGRSRTRRSCVTTPGTRRRAHNRNRNPRRIPFHCSVTTPRRCVSGFQPATSNRTSRNRVPPRRDVTASRACYGKRRGEMFNSFNCSRDTVVCQLCRRLGGRRLRRNEKRRGTHRYDERGWWLCAKTKTRLPLVPRARLATGN